MRKLVVVLCVAILSGCGLNLHLATLNSKSHRKVIIPKLSVGVDHEPDTFAYGFDCSYHGWHGRLGTWDPLYSIEFCRPTLDWTWNFSRSSMEFKSQWLWNAQSVLDIRNSTIFLNRSYFGIWNSWYNNNWITYYNNPWFGDRVWKRPRVRVSTRRGSNIQRQFEREILIEQTEMEYTRQRSINNSEKFDRNNVIRDYNTPNIGRRRMNPSPEIRTRREYRAPVIPAPSRTSGNTIDLKGRRQQ